MPADGTIAPIQSERNFSARPAPRAAHCIGYATTSEPTIASVTESVIGYGESVIGYGRWIHVCDTENLNPNVMVKSAKDRV